MLLDQSGGVLLACGSRGRRRSARDAPAPPRASRRPGCARPGRCDGGTARSALPAASQSPCSALWRICRISRSSTAGPGRIRAQGSGGVLERQPLQRQARCRRSGACAVRRSPTIAAPRRGVTARMPWASSSFSASRSGMRLTPRAAAIFTLDQPLTRFQAAAGDGVDEPVGDAVGEALGAERLQPGRKRRSRRKLHRSCIHSSCRRNEPVARLPEAEASSAVSGGVPTCRSAQFAVPCWLVRRSPAWLAARPRWPPRPRCRTRRPARRSRRSRSVAPCAWPPSASFPGCPRTPPAAGRNIPGRPGCWPRSMRKPPRRAARGRVPVSHETKVPILATGDADISIAPLSVTPKRQEVVDFIVYSKSSLCFFGKADNPKLQDVKDVDGLNSRRHHHGLLQRHAAGGLGARAVSRRCSSARSTGSGANAPVEEIMSGRADIAPIDNVAWPQLDKQVPGPRRVPFRRRLPAEQRDGDRRSAWRSTRRTRPSATGCWPSTTRSRPR